MVTLVLLVTGAVAVSVKVRSTYCAEPLMAVPPVVVVPAIEVQVVLSRMVATVPECSTVFAPS
jgi:hypothetical protein